MGGVGGQGDRGAAGDRADGQRPLGDFCGVPGRPAADPGRRSNLARSQVTPANTPLTPLAPHGKLRAVVPVRGARRAGTGRGAARRPESRAAGRLSPITC